MCFLKTTTYLQLVIIYDCASKSKFDIFSPFMKHLLSKEKNELKCLGKNHQLTCMFSL